MSSSQMSPFSTNDGSPNGPAEATRGSGCANAASRAGKNPRPGGLRQATVEAGHHIAGRHFAVHRRYVAQLAHAAAKPCFRRMAAQVGNSRRPRRRSMPSRLATSSAAQNSGSRVAFAIIEPDQLLAGNWSVRRLGCAVAPYTWRSRRRAAGRRTARAASRRSTKVHDGARQM